MVGIGTARRGDICREVAISGDCRKWSEGAIYIYAIQLRFMENSGFDNKQAGWLRMSITKCRACGEKIFFEKTKNGKSMPINTSDSVTPHWVTCPYSSDFKQKRKANVEENKKICEQLKAEKRKEYGLI